MVDFEQIVEMVGEEYESHLHRLTERLNMYFRRQSSDTQNVISAGLKVKNKETGIQYTISAVSSRDVTLKTPEGDLFKVSQADLEDKYELS